MSVPTGFLRQGLSLTADAATAFFSYSRDDSGFVIRLARDLKAAGASVWVDQLDIIPGQRWDRAIEDALKNCPCLIVILSPTSVESTNVMDEVSFALEEQKTVIPVIHRDCMIPFRLRRLQYVDFKQDYAHGLEQLLKVLAPQQKSEQSAPSFSGVRKQIHSDGPDTDDHQVGAEQTDFESIRQKTPEEAHLGEEDRGLGISQQQGSHAVPDRNANRQSRFVSASVEWKRKNEPDPTPRRWVVYVDNDSDAPITVEMVKVSSRSTELSIEDWGAVRPKSPSDYELEESDFDPSGDRPEVYVRFLDSYGQRWALRRGVLKRIGGTR